VSVSQPLRSLTVCIGMPRMFHPFCRSVLFTAKTHHVLVLSDSITDRVLCFLAILCCTFLLLGGMWLQSLTSTLTMPTPAAHAWRLLVMTASSQTTMVR
jgi:hypothetical protein